MMKKGFTILELVIVVAIIGILSSIIIIGLAQAQARARDAERITDLNSIKMSLQVYKSQTGHYPSGTANVAECSTWDAGNMSLEGDTFITELSTSKIMPLVPKEKSTISIAANDCTYKYKRVLDACGTFAVVWAQLETNQNREAAGDERPECLKPTMTEGEADNDYAVYLKE